MLKLLQVAGYGCRGISAIWFLIAAVQGGFLVSALFGFFGDKYDRHEADAYVFREHWEDAKGPFWLMVFGVGLLLLSTRT